MPVKRPMKPKPETAIDMSAPIKPTDSWQHDDIDMIIDVRAPAGADDHIIGAVNLPVLDDAERAQVGGFISRSAPLWRANAAPRWSHRILPAIGGAER